MENHRRCQGNAALDEAHHQRTALERSGNGLGYYLGVISLIRFARAIFRALLGSEKSELPPSTRVRGLF